MRMLVNVIFPVEKFNAAARDGIVAKKTKHILDELKPEAAYFTEQNGQRGVILIVDVPNPAKIPSIAEPWFLNFDAKVSFHVVMSPEELEQANVDELGKKWA